jgi:hypothetical protein
LVSLSEKGWELATALGKGLVSGKALPWASD